MNKKKKKQKQNDVICYWWSSRWQSVSNYTDDHTPHGHGSLHRLIEWQIWLTSVYYYLHHMWCAIGTNDGVLWHRWVIVSVSHYIVAVSCIVFFFFICSFLAFIYCIYWREKRALCTATWANRPSILHSLPFYVCVCVVFSCEWLTFWPIMECDDSVIGKISAVLAEQQMCAALWYVKRTASAPVMQLGCEKFYYKMWISYSYVHKS